MRGGKKPNEHHERAKYPSLAWEGCLVDAAHPALPALRDALPGCPGHCRSEAGRRLCWARARPGAAGLGAGPRALCRPAGRAVGLRRFFVQRAQTPAPTSLGSYDTLSFIGRLPGFAAATVNAIGRFLLPCAAWCGKCPRYRQWLPGPRRAAGGRAALRPPERGRHRLLADSISLFPAGC